MSDLIKIAVDAMGGDDSPKKVIDGIIHNHKSNNENFFKILITRGSIETSIKLTPEEPSVALTGLDPR